MQRYLSTAHRYRWLLAAMLLLVWGSGLGAAYVEYTNTFESQATIWVLRASPELTATNLDDPSVPIIQTVASQQAELLNQLLQTKSFLRDVVGRTRMRASLEATTDETRFLDEVRRRFRIQPLGTNMLRVAYAARDPQTGPEMVNAALAVRGERVVQARIAATTAVSTLYRREFEVSQAQALDAQRELDEFDASHRAPLSLADEHRHAQLRLALDFAQARLGDLKGRADRAVVAPMILEMSGMEFQVVDVPRVEPTPTGGGRSAMIIAAVALAAGAGLAMLLLVIGTLLADRATRPDVRQLATVQAART